MASFEKREDFPIPDHIEEVIAILENSRNENHNYPNYQKDLKKYLAEREEYGKRFF
jgi:hypothetical protein